LSKHDYIHLMTSPRRLVVAIVLESTDHCSG